MSRVDEIAGMTDAVAPKPAAPSDLERAAVPHRSTVDREFRFEDRHFEQIRQTLHALTGISLGDRKRDMVYARLARRLRVLGLPDFEAYCGRLQGADAAAEIPHLVNALTTNLTHFFREAHHFEHLAGVLDRRIAEAEASGQRRLRLWSAGCSTGEEPYSLAMVLLDRLGSRAASFDARVLATDIDTTVLETGRQGLYPADQAKGLSEDFRERFTSPVQTPAGPRLKLAQAVRDLIAFKPLNLTQAWPMKGPFDAIFCRNVLIYFDRQGRQSVVERFRDLLSDDGFLYLGHSETLHHVSAGFRPAGRTIWMPV